MEKEGVNNNDSCVYFAKGSDKKSPPLFFFPGSDSIFLNLDLTPRVTKLSTQPRIHASMGSVLDGMNKKNERLS
jgi:hypothetical protein